MKLKTEILKKVAESHGCRRRLMETLGVSAPTMSRYINDNDDNLTKLASLQIISAYFNQPVTELVEETENA